MTERMVMQARVVLFINVEPISCTGVPKAKTAKITVMARVSRLLLSPGHLHIPMDMISMAMGSKANKISNMAYVYLFIA
jgi:hypothetical protein